MAPETGDSVDHENRRGADSESARRGPARRPSACRRRRSRRRAARRSAAAGRSWRPRRAGSARRARGAGRRSGRGPASPPLPSASPKADADPREATARSTRINSPAGRSPPLPTQDPTRIARRTPSSARSASTSAALGPPIPVDWIVSSSPRGGPPRVAPEPAGVVAHLRLLEQLLGEQQRPAGVADQDRVGGDRGCRAGVSRASRPTLLAGFSIRETRAAGIFANRTNTGRGPLRTFSSPTTETREEEWAHEENRGVHPPRGVRADPGRAARPGASRRCRSSRPRARAGRRGWSSATAARP